MVKGEVVHGAYLKLIFAWMVLGSIQLMEPSPFDIVFLLCAALGIGFACVSFERYQWPAFALLLVFLNCNLFTIAMADYDLGRALQFFLITLYVVGLWVLVVGVVSKGGVQAADVILKGYLATALLAALLGILGYFQLVPGWENLVLWERARALFKDPNVFGPFLIPASLYAFFLFEKDSRTRAWIWLVTFIILSVGVFLSYSRAAWGSFLLSFAIYEVLPSPVPRSRRLTKLAKLALFGLPVVAVLLMHTEVFAFAGQRLGLQGYDRYRFATQLSSLHLFESNLFGIGPGQSELAFNYSTHSLYIRVLTEYGLVGALAFLNLLALSGYRSLRQSLTRTITSPYAGIVTASLAGIFFNSFFIDTLHWRHFWLLLALPWISIEEEDG